MKLLKKAAIFSLSAATILTMTGPAAFAAETGESESISESTSAADAAAWQGTPAEYRTLFLASSAKNKPYKVINHNRPKFKKSQLTKKSFEHYSKLDSLGRCGTAFANVSKSTMPKGKRGAIGMIKPTGWHTVKYSNVPGRYLYNRCHLIGYQLTAENANERNLITGTRYLNIEGMLPYENMVADYVRETGNHVLYRVKPDFKGKNLLASGVYMEAESVEDNGAGISYNVYCYNIQPGIKINYKTGDSSKTGSSSDKKSKKQTNSGKKQTQKNTGKATYVYLSRTGTKYHRYSCGTLSRSKASRSVRKVTRAWAKKNGYSACKVCKP